MPQLSSNLTHDQLQNRWSSILNPIIANPMTNPSIIKGIRLAIGANTINHGLQQQLQGWFITDINAAATIYRSQPLNDTTITLTSSAVVTIDLGVF